MNLGTAKDIVREHVARTGFPTFMLDEALASGRREVEKHGDWYWMRKRSTNLATVNAQQTYSVTLSTSNGFGLTNFKRAIAMAWKESSDTSFFELDFNETSLEDATMLYPTDASGRPELVVLDYGTNTPNVDAVFFPIPDAAYTIALWRYEWTANPTGGNTATDELLTRFPEALIYGALVWVHESYLKDLQGAQYWRNLLGVNPAGMLIGGEIAKIKRFNLDRIKMDQIYPRTGRLGRRNRLANRSYGASWTRL